MVAMTGLMAEGFKSPADFQSWTPDVAHALSGSHLAGHDRFSLNLRKLSTRLVPLITPFPAPVCASFCFRAVILRP